MPTEAEWEYVAMAPKSGFAEFDYSGGQNAEDVGWGLSNSEGIIHPVKRKKPNAFGLDDMSGNVEEWCHDWYSEYTTKAYFDPMGRTSGTEKVTRGGSYRDEVCSSSD